MELFKATLKFLVYLICDIYVYNLRSMIHSKWYILLFLWTIFQLNMFPKLREFIKFKLTVQKNFDIFRAVRFRTSCIFSHELDLKCFQGC